MVKIFNEEKYENKLNDDIKKALGELRDNFNVIYTSRYKEYKIYCDRLMAYAVDEQSDYLFALSYYYLTEYYTSDDNFQQIINCALDGLRYQQLVNEYELMARSYNLLGTASGTMGDMGKSVEYFMKGIDCCEKNGLYYVNFMIGINLADIFRRASKNERALYYFSESAKNLALSDKEKSFEVYSSTMNLECNMGNCLLLEGRIDEANKCGEKIEKYIKEMEVTGEDEDLFYLRAFIALLAYKNNDLEKMEEYIQKTYDCIDVCENYISSIDDVEAFINLHMELGRYGSALKLLEFYLAKCNDITPFYVYKTLLELGIRGAIIIGDDEAYIKYSRRFFKLYRKFGMLNSEIPLRAESMYKENRRIQKQQYEMELINNELLSEAQHDTLTGLPNRAYMNSYAEELFDRAIKSGEKFGVEMLDIDSFKKINDNYGHLTGDNYLIALAEILQKIADEYDDVFAARYGGDEFVVIYYSKTDEEIGSIMGELKEYMRTVKLDNTSITISQGCFNRVPNSLNRIWDYFSEADQTLYGVKQDGKNNYRIKSDF